MYGVPEALLDSAAGSWWPDAVTSTLGVGGGSFLLGEHVLQNEKNHARKEKTMAAMAVATAYPIVVSLVAAPGLMLNPSQVFHTMPLMPL